MGDVILGAAGLDFALAKVVKLAKGEGFSAGLEGGEVVEGKLSPLNASVNPPKLEDDDCGAGDAKSPNEDSRSCCTGGWGLE